MAAKSTSDTTAPAKSRATRGGNGDGGVRMRYDGRYEARYTDPQSGKRVTISGRQGETKESVKKRLREALTRADAGLPPEPTGRQTLGAFLDDWLTNTIKPRARAKTFLSYELAVRLYLKPQLGRVALKALSAQQVQRLVTTLSSTTSTQTGRALSPKYVKTTLAVLHAALEDARRFSLVAHNAAEPVRPPRQQVKRVEAISRERARAILDAFAGHRWRALITVGLSLGLRQGECLGLTWDCVNLDARRLTVRQQVQRIKRDIIFSPPKSAAGERVISLPPTIAEELRQQRVRVLEERLAAGERWQDFNLVFPSEVGTPLNASNVTHRFKEQLVAAGLPPMRFHDLRHAAATLMIAQGVQLRMVQAALGHAQMSLTTDLYGHVAEEMMADIADRMEAVFTRVGGKNGGKS